MPQHRTDNRWTDSRLPQSLALSDGILRERTPDGRCLVVWAPGTVNRARRPWERITSLPGTEFVADPGVWAVGACSLPTTELSSGLIGRLWERMARRTGKTTWMLPTGRVTEQAGEKQADLLLVWADDECIRLDEDWLRRRWPQCSRHRLRCGRGSLAPCLGGMCVVGQRLARAGRARK